MNTYPMDSIDHHTATAETAIAEAARAGWHAGDHPVGDNICRALADLGDLAYTLPEVLDHLSVALHTRAGIGGLRLDSHGQAAYGTNVDQAVTDARAALADARDHANRLAQALDTAQNITATIADTGNLPPDPDSGPCHVYQPGTDSEVAR